MSQADTSYTWAPVLSCELTSTQIWTSFMPRCRLELSRLT